MKEQHASPRDVVYSPDHMWVYEEGNDVVVGLTRPGQKELGDIVFVELPAAGDSVTRDAPFGTVEAMKTVAELISPVSGTVAEVNFALESAPGLINSDPYGEGWMIRVTGIDREEMASLMSPAEYDAHCRGGDG